MSRPTNSADSVANASETTDIYSDERRGQGAQGVVEDNAIHPQDSLDRSGESGLITAPDGGFKKIHVGLSWDNIVVKTSGGFMGLIKKATKQGVDLDLGCFFELKNGTRGILQSFGDLHGKLDDIPYIELSKDERTGNAKGDDESLTINGQEWSEIKRVLVYAYIYEGATNWNEIKPKITIDLKNGDTPIKIEPSLKTTQMTVCALATIENVKNAINIKTHGEYFTSQASMDRAFGFGLKWEDGAKD